MRTAKQDAHAKWDSTMRSIEAEQGRIAELITATHTTITGLRNAYLESDESMLMNAKAHARPHQTANTHDDETPQLTTPGQAQSIALLMNLEQNREIMENGAALYGPDFHVMLPRMLDLTKQAVAGPQP